MRKTKADSLCNVTVIETVKSWWGLSFFFFFFTLAAFFTILISWRKYKRSVTYSTTLMWVVRPSQLDPRLSKTSRLESNISRRSSWVARREDKMIFARLIFFLFSIILDSRMFQASSRDCRLTLERCRTSTGNCSTPLSTHDKWRFTVKSRAITQ